MYENEELMMKLGTLEFGPASQRLDLVAEPVKTALSKINGEVMVAEIDPSLSDTAAFCEHYGIGMEVSANCVVVEAKRSERVWYAACMVLATSRADVNGVIRKQLDARRLSFAPMDTAVSLTQMEYGGITPIGLPDNWQLLVDTAITDISQVIIGSGIRQSKLLVPGTLLGQLPGAVVMDLTKAG
jgi:prolyl-tRNA editing enzyme YbaK/EbsC (Cys-tRNA(Pro) deacylase)